MKISGHWKAWTIRLGTSAVIGYRLGQIVSVDYPDIDLANPTA